MFSLFYGLPPGYWSSFSSLQKPTVLVDELQERNYQLGLFSSATMYRPVVLDRTAFANVPDLRIVTEPASDPAWKRDRKLTEEWFEWLDERDTEQAVLRFPVLRRDHRQELPAGSPGSVSSPKMQTGCRRDFADYKSSVHYVDSLVGEVLEDLERRGLMDNTVVADYLGPR